MVNYIYRFNFYQLSKYVSIYNLERAFRNTFHFAFIFSYYKETKNFFTSRNNYKENF